MDTKLIIFTLLPVFFMFHEFEEIVFLKYWLKKDKVYLHNKFPKIGPKIFSQYCNFSAGGFALAIAEEFILICAATYFSIIFDKIYIWIAAFMGFYIHIFIHIIQWIIYRKYLPTIATSFFVLLYFVYSIKIITNYNVLEIHWIIISSIIGVIIATVNLKRFTISDCNSFCNIELANSMLQKVKLREYNCPKSAINIGLKTTGKTKYSEEKISQKFSSEIC